MERPDQLGHGDIADEQMREADMDEGPYHRNSQDSIQNSRPPTPFNPLMMMTTAAGANKHTDKQREYMQIQQHHNPFSSPEDEEADDVVSPILPSRSPERRHSPQVHYPSWSEVSEFDFGNGRGKEHHSSSESGGDGWRPLPVAYSTYGRHELP
jgi:hypothetical protein